MSEKRESSKPIHIKYEDGREYTLEFNVDSIVYLEDSGFKRNEVFDKLEKNVLLLFHAAFRMHNPELTKAETDKILFEDLGGVSDELAARLIDLYNDQYAMLLNESGKPKNPKMKVIL